MFTPSRRTTLPAAALIMLLSTAGCGSSETDRSAAAPSAALSAAPSASSSAVPSPPSPPSSAAPGGAEQGQCQVTPQELEAATGLTWRLGRTLPERPLEYDKTITVSTCAFISEEATVKDDYGQPLTMRIDVATGANAAALEKSNLEACGEGIPPGTMRAARGGGGAKVCDVKGSVEEATIVEDGTTLSFTMFSDSDKILKDFSPKFEAVISAIAG